MYPGFLEFLGCSKLLGSLRPSPGGRWVSISCKSIEGRRDTWIVQAESSRCMPIVGNGNKAWRWLVCSTSSKLVCDFASGDIGCDIIGILWWPQWSHAVRAYRNTELEVAATVVFALPVVGGFSDGELVVRREKDIDFFGCLTVIYSQLSLSAWFLR